MFQHLGYRCDEWVGMKESESQLGAFCFGAQDEVALVLFVQNHGTRRNCDLLVPVNST
jgi:hypothetical protein